MGTATARVITLTTDFGSSDAYVAAMKGVILSINPQATIVDLCHSIQPYNIPQAAFVLSTAHRYFPQGAIHIVVVDPGVGSLRRAVLLVTPSAFFVAPDNGSLSYVIGKQSTELKEGFPQIQELGLSPSLQGIVLSNPRFWHHPVSSTFHGRDIFAPVAAHLSLGVSPQEFGETTLSLLGFPIPRPELRAEGEILGQILHIDHFGNLITNIQGNDLSSRDVIIEVRGHHIEGLSPSYQQSGKLLALVGSSDYLEIASRRKSAARLLRAKVGDEVRVLPGQRVKKSDSV